MWYCYAVLLLTVVGVMQVQTVHPLQRDRFTMADVVSFVFGALTQQGSTIEMPTVSGRLVVLTTFLANLALFTSYSGTRMMEWLLMPWQRV